MTLFTKNKENWTRFKIGLKQIYTIPPTVLLALGEPTKKTTRFYYWEKKGDFLNGRDLDQFTIQTYYKVNRRIKYG